MTDRPDQHGILCGPPPILSDVAVAPAREAEFPAAIHGFTSPGGMVRSPLACAAHAQELLTGAGGIFLHDEIEEALEVRDRPFRYFDARQVRALGRRALFPAIRSSR